MNRIILTILSLLVFFSLSAAIPAKPVPQKLVNDFANVLSDSQRRQLEAKLNYLSNASTTQIVLVTVNSLDGEIPSMFAYEIGEKWGVGDKKFDNGIVVLFKPKTASSSGQIFIATGYGLEDIIPDAIAKTIVENEMIPEFKRGDIFKGIDNGINVLIELSLGKYSASDYKKTTNGKGKIGGSLLGLIIFFFLISNILGGARRIGRSSIGRSGLSTFLLLSMLGSGRNHSGSFGSFSSGGGSFGGFGGGSFGGGGAGGSW